VSWSDTYGLKEYCALVGSPCFCGQRGEWRQMQKWHATRRQRLLRLLLHQSLRRVKLSQELRQAKTTIPLADLSSSLTCTPKY